jgi:hypothetical protein
VASVATVGVVEDDDDVSDIFSMLRWISIISQTFRQILINGLGYYGHISYMHTLFMPHKQWIWHALFKKNCRSGQFCRDSRQ